MARKQAAQKAAENTDEIVERAATEATKKSRNFTDAYHTKFGFENAEPGDNARYLRYAMASLDLPPIDISDEKQVQQRLVDYFSFCAENDRKPSMVGMANWLGVDQTTLTSWKRGEYRSATHSPLIRKACAVLEEMMVDYFQNGKVNPASGIFLLKNMFQYKDVQDVVVTPNNPLGDTAAQKALEDKYLDIVEVSEDPQ